MQQYDEIKAIVTKFGKANTRTLSEHLGYHFTRVKVHVNEMVERKILEVCGTELLEDTGDVVDVYRIRRHHVCKASRIKQYTALYHNWKNCENCSAGDMREKIVFGRGNLMASMMLIGDSPSEAEDVSGLPFTGTAGRNLDQVMKSHGFTMNDAFVTNLTCCYNRMYVGDMLIRKATGKEEAKACRPHLEALLDLVYPSVVVFVGDVADKFFGNPIDGLPLVYKGVHFLRSIDPLLLDISDPDFIQNRSIANSHWKRIRRSYDSQTSSADEPNIVWQLPLIVNT